MKKHSILFIDDEEYVLNSIKRNLGTGTYRTYFAQNAKEALDILEKEEITVVLSDLQMPGMNGIELLELIEKKYPNIVKIVASGNKQVSNIISTVNKCMVFKYLIKPWDHKNELLPALQDAVTYYEVRIQGMVGFGKDFNQESAQNLLSALDNVLYDLKLAQVIIADMPNMEKEDLKKQALDNYAKLQATCEKVVQIQRNIQKLMG